MKSRSFGSGFFRFKRKFCLEEIFLQLEKNGRSGKTVTVLRGFTHETSYLKEFASRLKKSCGAGGTLKGRDIEIQGDFRVRVREILLREGFQVKG
jgi:translation initiation factor 1